MAHSRVRQKARPVKPVEPQNPPGTPIRKGPGARGDVKKFPAATISRFNAPKLIAKKVSQTNRETSK